ncbi:MAG: hypothetical protein U1F49_01180 [Rubrivivax sp.]
MPSKRLPCRQQVSAAPRAFAWACLAWFATSVCGVAHAQLLDELDLRREGADAVLAIRLVSDVQFVRAVGSSAGDQSLIFFIACSPRRRHPGRSRCKGSPAAARWRAAAASRP